jgi:hypothetical protein
MFVHVHLITLKKETLRLWRPEGGGKIGQLILPPHAPHERRSHHENLLPLTR